MTKSLEDELMPSLKVVQILRSKTDLLDEQIADLSESEAWKIVYELDAVERTARRSIANEVCFTGFSMSEKERLTTLASDSGFLVRESVTRTLTLLCAGPNAGPSKLSKAKTKNVRIVSVDEFHALLKAN